MKPEEIPAAEALAQQMFPVAWAVMLTLVGKKRGRRRKGLREQAVHDVKIQSLKSLNACCANCKHKSKGPLGIGGLVCGLQSDFAGYVKIKPEYLCVRWGEKV